MRILFLTSSSARYMAPPRLGAEQINGGPDWADECTPDGRVLSLRTPVGEYDLGAILARLPVGQQPDAVVALVDSSWRNKPVNVGAFAGPKALLVADTHHLQSPLIGMLTYMASEAYDRLVLLYDRHHAEIFRSAGLTNLYWLPGLTFPHDDATVRAVRRARRAPQIAFVGQAGKLHPRRSHLLEAMQMCHLPVDRHMVDQRSGLALYGSKLLAFNASLNGDLNLRVMEILASGAALLTDRLAPASGFDQLWCDGEHAITYGNADELVERTERALADPSRTARIGAAGAAWFDRHWNEARRRELFTEVLLHGRAVPPFALPEPASAVFFPGDTDRLLQATMLYEGLQELHRKQETVHVALGDNLPAEIPALLATLPRIASGPAATLAAPDMLLFSREAAEVVADTTANRLWCADAQAQDFPVLAEVLAPAGYQLVSEEVAVLCREAAPAPAKSDSAPEAAHVLVFTDDPSLGGVAHYNHSLIMGLIAAGYRVSCAQSTSDNPLVAEQRAAGVVHHWISYDTQKEFGRTITDNAEAQRVIAAAAPDLIVFSDCCPLSNLAGRQVALQARIPFVVVVGFVGAYLADRFKQLLPTLAAQYAQARAVVAVSQENLELLHQRFGLPAHAGMVVHYGRPERYFAPRDEATRARLRAELGLGEDAVVCFTAARLAPVKGYGYQLEAARVLRDDPAARNLHFVWAGDGELRADLEREIAASGLTGRVHLLGHRWDVADWFDAADIFALPSDLEGMPLAIMEAMAKGLPVVATAVSGIPEELGGTGALLPPASVDRGATVRGLTATLRAWSRDSGLRTRLGTAARQRAEAMFRESLMIERTVTQVTASLTSVGITRDRGAANVAVA